MHWKQKSASWCLLAVALLAAGLPAPAEEAKGKPPVYTYLAEWNVPRTMWPDMQKLAESDKVLMDKLVANGTIVGYGAYQNLIHQEGVPTHGSWFTATSEGKLLKALEAIYAEPGSISAPVEAASKHWDFLMVSEIHNEKAGAYPGGYLSGVQWDVKPGEMRAYNDLVKSTLVPVFEKLLADGVLTAYGLETEDYHQEKLGRVSFYMTTRDADGVDKASKAFDDAFDKNPALGAAFRSMVEHSGHRDFLLRLNYMTVK